MNPLSDDAAPMLCPRHRGIPFTLNDSITIKNWRTSTNYMTSIQHSYMARSSDIFTFFPYPFVIFPRFPYFTRDTVVSSNFLNYLWCGPIQMQLIFLVLLYNSIFFFSQSCTVEKSRNNISMKQCCPKCFLRNQRSSKDDPKVLHRKFTIKNC